MVKIQEKQLTETDPSANKADEPGPAEGPDDCMLTVQVSVGGHQGYLVIDTIMNNTSSGGVRIADDLTLEEVKALAKEMSLKYALFGLPQGGAKAGLTLSSNMSGEEKGRILEAFGHKLALLIRLGLYNPGTDINCGMDELQRIYRGAGQDLGLVSDTSFFTALTVESAVEVCAEHVSASGRKLRVAIEGFGRVAAHLAARIPEEKYEITAVSTHLGAVLDDRGFSIERLVEMQREFGDRFVEHLPGTRIAKEEVPLTEVDLFLPSARTWSIKRESVPRIHAKAIIPVANAPYEEGSIAALSDRGVICLPGYVSNAGGVFASSLFDQGVTIPEIETILRQRYRPMLRRLIAKSRDLGISPVDLALALARDAQGRRDGVLVPKRVKLYRRLQKQLVPNVIKRLRARRRCLRVFDAIDRAIASAE